MVKGQEKHGEALGFYVFRYAGGKLKRQRVIPAPCPHEFVDLVPMKVRGGAGWGEVGWGGVGRGGVGKGGVGCGGARWVGGS